MIPSAVCPCLCVSTSRLLALYMSVLMYMVSIYDNSSAPKGRSLYTETTAIKTCQTDGREVRGSVSKADK